MMRIAALAGNRIQENPSIAAGICIFVFSFSLVAANALVGQTGGHPGPIWATRDIVTTRSVPAANRRSARPARAAVEVLSLESVPVPIMRPANDASQPVTFLVRDAQAGLAQLGFYSGTVDGIYGPRTREAVVEFQRFHGLTEDGEISTLLTGAIDKAVVIEKDPVGAVETALMRDRPNSVPASNDDNEIRIELLNAKPDPATASGPDVQRTAMVARIQIGLNNFGETGITINGTIDENTLAAIRTFQSRYNLPVTGEVDQSLMDKLEEIGALRQR